MEKEILYPKTFVVPKKRSSLYTVRSSLIYAKPSFFMSRLNLRLFLFHIGHWPMTQNDNLFNNNNELIDSINK